MPATPIARVRAGAILAEDVTDRHGRVLIRGGTSVSAKDIESLRMWGVTFLELQGTDEADPHDPVGPEPWAREAAREAIGERFRFTREGHPLIDALRRCSYALEASRIQTRGRDDTEA